MFESTTLYYHSKCGTLSNLTSCFRSVNNSNHSVNSFPFFGWYFTSLSFPSVEHSLETVEDNVD